MGLLILVNAIDIVLLFLTRSCEDVESCASCCEKESSKEKQSKKRERGTGIKREWPWTCSGPMIP